MGAAGTFAVCVGLLVSTGATGVALYEVHTARAELAKSHAEVVTARNDLRSAREVVGLLANRVDNLENEWLTLAVVREVAERSPLPSPTTSAPTPNVLAPAMVSFNSLPPSSVTLDGQALGQTPRIRVFVAPGHHEAHFSTDSDARVVRFDASSGEVKTVTAKLATALPALPGQDGF